MNQSILIPNGFVAVPASVKVDSPIGAAVATILSNLASYGYTLDPQSLEGLLGVNIADLTNWWQEIEPVLKEITGADRNMGDHIVYRNFPREVLDMDTAEQVARQILIYMGVPYDALTEDEDEREPLGKINKLKVLARGDEHTLDRIYGNLRSLPNRWSDNQIVWAEQLIGDRNVIIVDDFGFKENGIRLAAKHFSTKEVEMSAATDVLRLCAALSDADISLREKVKLRSFKRAERRKLLQMLEQTTHLDADMAERPEQWKRLLEHLRPGDYKFERVKAAYDALYNRRVKTFAALVDPQSPDMSMLDTIVQRPGEFLRRFHHFYDLFGTAAVERFVPLMDKLTTRQLVSLRGYLRTINTRKQMIYAPKGNWARAQVKTKTKKSISALDITRLDDKIGALLHDRLAESFPEGVGIDQATNLIKLQTNDQKLADYGRGTVFPIPPEMTFIRSASYWANDPAVGVTWYDNGWNFFTDDWSAMGTCAWNAQNFVSGAAIFSGDPVNTHDLKGRACQMADLYLDKLDKAGVRYAVWNVLCYSRKKFSEAEEVLATLQWGENAETGKTYEPARAQMVFPLRSEALSSYVAYIDIKTRELVFMDVAFPADVSNAAANSERLSSLMPAYQEYLEALPSVYDLMKDAPVGTMPVYYDDDNAESEAFGANGERAFVFRPSNPDHAYERVSVAELMV